MSVKKDLTRRQFCKLAAGSGLAAGFCGFSAALAGDKGTPAAKRKQPNIVLIFTDDQGIGDVSLYGSEISTPNMDRIGTEGIKFNNFYVTFPVCTPSRYSLLTGRYPYRAPKAFVDALLPKDRLIRAYICPKMILP